MKKWLALLLCALLCQSALAAASEEVQEDAYAQEVFALLEDPQVDVITIQEDVEVKADGRYFCYVKGGEDQEKVLDLNGHTLVCKGIYNYTSFRLTDSVGGGKVVLTAGTIGNSGALLIDGVTVVSEEEPAIINFWSGILHIAAGNVSAYSSRCALNNDGGICIIDGGLISGEKVAIWSAPGGDLYGATSLGGAGGATRTRWQSGTLMIGGGLIEGDLELHDTDVTITGGVVRGQIEIEQRNEYKDGESIKLATPQEMQYYNAAGETITLPKPTYELHEDNGEMKRGYWDVPMDAWFYAPVQALMDTETLGYGKDGNFGPAEPLTRGQAAALLARVCGVETQEEWDASVFLDVAEATPYGKYINAGQKAGLLSGDGQGQFHPENTITRQEFAVLVMNAVHKCGLELSLEPQSVSFLDKEAIALWAKDAVAEGASYGLWNGTDSGDFLPLNPISRAEAAAILARIPELHIMIGL